MKMSKQVSFKERTIAWWRAVREAGPRMGVGRPNKPAYEFADDFKPYHKNKFSMVRQNKVRGQEGPFQGGVAILTVLSSNRVKNDTSRSSRGHCPFGGGDSV